ncbi:gliding motility-associated C-terminal domain-containing protein [Capnocytophaga sp. oral taxon 878]|uniref:T9SS type B sorting domain-containing protein n=1 Tax=Capnocytophaga sp. oral taxon 878 TaxID=1316596 RepID=UPI000D02DA65|nr:gliding motility-associated C-terminal domain-containing protein [Capnocytophaga sp. oral taxon 878]AVM50135.1 hypothetical protein C4H12_06475 [Capnocytophaga sp. oral taxon 878]
MKKIAVINLMIVLFLLSFGYVEAQTCATMPEPVIYTRISGDNNRVEEYADVRGVRVTRILEVRGHHGDKIMYSDEDSTPMETYCGKNRKTTFGGKKYPFMDSNKVNKITYKFSKPVNDVEIFFAAFGFNGTRETWKQHTPHKDVVKITVNNGDINLALRSTCETGAVTISGNEVSSENEKTTDAKVGISSSSPFTELTLEFLEPSGQTGGYGFFVEICLASIATPIAGSTCSPPSIGDPFSSFPTQTVSLAGMTITRRADIGINKTTSFSGAHCGSNITYPSKDPLLKDSKKIVYEFSTPIKSAEIFLLAFGDNMQINTFDKAKFEVNGGGNITLTKSYDCNPIASTINGNIVGSINNRKLTTDVGIKVTSTKPFSKITLTDMGSTGNGYLVALCPTSVTKAAENDVFTIDMQPAANNVCAGTTPSYTAKATANFSGGTFKYELQAKKTGGTWQTIAIEDNKISGSTVSFNEAELANLAYNQANIRIKYIYKNLTEFSSEIVRYSNEATLTINDVEVTQVTATPLVFKQGDNTAVSFVIEGTPGAQVTFKVGNEAEQTQTLDVAGKYNVPSRTVNQTLELSVSKVKKGTCQKTYTDKKGRAEATTAACVAKPAPQFSTASPNGATAVMGNVVVTRTYSEPSKSNLVYGNTDPLTYCSGSTYHNYTIIHSTNVTFSKEVIYTFSKPVNSAEVWLMVMGSPAGQYDEVSITTNNGTPTFTKVYDCIQSKGGMPASLTGNIVKSNPRIGSADNINDVAIRVTSATPFTELRVKDIGTVSSGVLVELCPSSINPAETISITTQPQNQTICDNATAIFTSKAQLKDATGNINYKWQQSSNGTTWTDIPSFAGTIPSGGTTTLTIAGTTNYKYRVEYSYQFAAGIVVTATSQEATLTKLPSVALPTLTGNRTLCPTATNNNVLFADYVTAPTGTTLLWYATSTATVSSTTAPSINTNVATRTTKTAYVRALSSTGCTSGLVTVTLTVNDTTVPTFNAPAALNIVCNSATATTAINNWLNTATATDACGAIATITNDYIVPANLCNVSGGVITVTFVAKDTFGNVLTKTSTIKLGVTSLTVVSDTFTVGNGLTATTTGSVLNNDRLNGNVPTAGPSGTVSITNITPATPVRTGAKVPELNPNDGKVTIPAGTPAGTYTITYKECESLNPSSNCRTATAVIKVGVPTITVTPDPITAAPSTSTQTTPSILNNDKIGSTVTPTVGVGGNVTLTVTNPSGPGNKPTLAPNTGKVTIPANTPAGSYTITYSYCEVLNPTNCTGTQTLVVTVGAVTLTVDNDIFNIPDGLTTQTTTSVLTNDRLNGNVPTAGVGGTVTITNVVPATPVRTGAKVPELNPNDGKVTIPAGTPAGTYTITYKECESLNPSSNCRTATAVIKVGVPTITVTPDPITAAPSTSTQTTPSILNNDKIGSTVTPTVGVGGNVTLTVTNPSGPGNKPTLDPNTGKVTIPANTPAGSYTITYSYCEVLNPTNCTGTQTLVVTVGAVTLTVDNDIFNIPDGLTTQTTTSVLANDRLNGNVPTAGVGGTVTITNVVPATPVRTGAKVPELNPNDGKVTIPAGTPAGTYTITYKECESLNPSSNCRTATAVIKVGVPTITVTPDPITAAPSTSTQTTPSILNNDKIGSTVTPTVGVGGNVTLTVTNPTGTTVPTLDKDTGKVTIPANTPAGSYTITYSYCEVLNPTNCTGTQTLVVTVGAVTLTVDNDTFNIPDGLTTQTTTSVLTNDRLNGNVPTAGVGGTVTITNVVPATPVRTGAKVPELNPNDGKVTIPANTPAGTYTITYKECESLNPSSNCRTATAVIKVGVPTITVTPDPITAAPSTSTQTTPSILNNDKIGSTVTPTVGVGGNVTLTVTNPSGPGNKPTLAPNTGKVTIPANTPAGSYTITYSYCEVLNPTNCTGTQTLVVTVGAVTLTVDNDTFNIPDGLTTQTTTSVLTNDRLNGNVPTAGVGGTVTITNVVPATPVRTGAKVPELNPNDGKVTIPAGTPAGTYSITYKECESLNPSSNCRTATAVIKVGIPTITVTPDPITAAPSTSTQTTPSILNNDKIGSTVTPTVGVGGNVTLTVTNPSGPGNKPTLDPNTGKVTIPANTPAGSYTITYSYCEVLNPTNCTGTQTLVVTVGAVTLTVDNDIFNIPDGLTTQTTTSVLTNDRLNGNVPTAGVGGTVTITNVVPATPVRTGAKVPELNPNDGKVTIPAGTPAGTYTITYKECESLNPSSNCRTATAVIKVGVPTITVTPDPITAAPSTSTQTTPSILNNDKIGSTVTPTVGVGGNVTLTVTNPTGTTVPTLDKDTGKVTIPANTPAGSYTITYSYCEVLNPTNCTGTQTLVVTVGAVTLTVDNDTFNIPDGLTTQTTTSVLTNDRLNGNVPTAGVGGTVTITNVVPATPVRTGAKVPELNPNDGKVTIPANTPAGTYTITYKECESLNPSSNCRTATAVIKVGVPTITVTPDPITAAPSTSTQTTPSILNNDKIGSTVTPTVGVGGNVTLTVTNPSGPGNKPTLAPNTGKVTIPANTPAGSYTITYSYCEVLNPTNCTGTQTLVVTVGAVTLTVDNDTFNIPDGLTTQTTTSVLTNDRLNGNVPTAGVGGTVTITNVVPATPVRTGAKVPELNPNDGKVTIPAGTPAGTYSITYKECESLNPSSNCRTATAVIKVGIPTITVTPDPITAAPSTSTQTTPSILNNDKIGSTVTPTVGVGGNVTLTVTNPTGTTVPTLDKDTGKITIPANTPAGNYTITYSYCEILNPTNCTGTQTLVVTVSGTFTPTLPIAVTDSATTAMNTPITIVVLANDTLNGATTPNVVTPPANGNVVVNADNTVEYRPNTGFVGTDTFEYEICNTSGCATTTVTVQVVKEMIIYNGISLSGSPANNHFHIAGIESYPNNIVRIYNRWGVEVFKVEGYNNVTKVFKGISDGRVTIEASDKLPQGTYYYVIEYYDETNNKQTKTGWLYLKK